MAELLACSRGFLIARQEDGTYRPFFVRVREEDILWSDGSHGGGGSGGGEGGGSSTGSSVVMKTMSGWVVETIANEYLTMSKPIVIDDTIFRKDENDDTKLVGTVTLPYEIASEAYFTADVGINGQNDNIATATVNITPVLNRSKVEKVTITIRNLIYNFSDEWFRDPTYERSKIYLRVSGKKANT